MNFMKQRLNSWLSLTLPGILLVLIFIVLGLMSLLEIKIRQLYEYFVPPLKKTTANSNNWSRNKGNPSMSPVIKPEVVETLPYTNFLDKCQAILRKKYLRIDGIYYDIIDEVQAKIKEFDFTEEMKRKPNLKLTNYTFIDDWESGLISSQEVLNILVKWNVVEVANLAVTRRLRNYVHLAPETKFVVDLALEKIRRVIIPEYVGYLTMMKNFFAKAAECDSKQIKVTWMEIKVDKDDSRSSSTYELTLNQSIRQIDTFVIKYVNNSFFLGKNAILINETLDDKGVARSHWIFAPEAYINLLKKMYKIDDELDDADDAAYLKGLLTGPTHVA